MCLFLCVFFFFKQKTAYEMRISDWSSDVCSSDLGPICPSPNKATNRVMTAHNRIAPITHRPIAQGLRCASIAHPRLEIDLVDLKDRKSVVSGKSVSVRVDLGGRRIIKKKQKETMLQIIRQ